MKCSDYYPGLLIRKAWLQNDSTQDEQVPDEAGGFENTWADAFPVWASIGPLSGRESFFAQSLQSVITGRLLCRYRDDINDKMRIRYPVPAGDRFFKVRAVINVEEANRWLVVFYDEGVAT